MKKLTYIITPIKHDSGTSAKILIQGELSLNHLNDLLSDLKIASEKFTDIEIVLRNIENIDLASIQLFYSLKQTFIGKNKTLTFSVELNEVAETLLNQTGFIDLKSALETKHEN
jgi:ABC-type transporter Mla MlaB component